MTINLKKTQIELLKTLISLNKINPNLININQKEYIDIIDRITQKLKELNTPTIEIDQKFINGLDPLVRLISGFSTEPVNTEIGKNIKINRIAKYIAPEIVGPDLTLNQKTGIIPLEIKNIPSADDFKSVEKINQIPLNMKNIPSADDFKSVEKIDNKTIDFSSWDNLPADDLTTKTTMPKIRLSIPTIPITETSDFNYQSFNNLSDYRLANQSVFIRDEETETQKRLLNTKRLLLNQINTNNKKIKEAINLFKLPINNAKRKIELYKNIIVKPIDEITVANQIYTTSNLLINTLPDITDVPTENEEMNIDLRTGVYTIDGNIQLGGFDLPYKSFIPNQINIINKQIKLLEREQKELIVELNLVYIQFTYYYLFIINKARELLTIEKEGYIFLIKKDFDNYYEKIEYCNYWIDNPDLSNETIKIWYFKHYFIIKILYEIFNVLKDIINESNYIDLFIDDFKELSILFNFYYDKLNSITIPEE
jgi:hypothetical protein